MKYRLYRTDSRSSFEPDYPNYPDGELYLVYDSAKEAVEAKVQQMNGKITVIEEAPDIYNILIFINLRKDYIPLSKKYWNVFDINDSRFAHITNALYERYIKEDLRIFPHEEEKEQLK